jgi:Domain of unknown function (DUF4124)
MKTLIFKCTVAVMLALGLSNYFIYLKTGKVPLGDWPTKVSNFIANKQIDVKDLASDAKKMANKATGDTLAIGDDGVKVYKWTDAKGVVHYDSKPVEGAKVLTIDTDTNVLTSDDLPKKIEKESGSKDNEKSVDEKSVEESLKNLDEKTPIEKAQAVSDAMKARTKQQEQAY